MHALRSPGNLWRLGAVARFDHPVVAMATEALPGLRPRLTRQSTHSKFERGVKTGRPRVTDTVQNDDGGAKAHDVTAAERLSAATARRA